MTRLLTPLAVADISAFAKTLKTQLDARHASGKAPPSHLELLNLLARCGGHRNYQNLRACKTLSEPPAAAPPNDQRPADPQALPTAIPAATELATLSPTVRKALMQFDAAGRLVRLPAKLSVQQTCMWWLWTHFAIRRKYTEKEVNLILNAHHTFGDQATLRRELVNMKLLGRKDDCSAYWKEPLRPDAQAQAFLTALRKGLANG